MASFPLLLVLLALLCSSLALASNSEPTLSWTCGDDQVAILETSGGGRNLSVNGELVQDHVLGCDKLRSYYESRCLRCGEQSNAWRGAWKHYCREGSESSNAQNITRKLLRQPSMNDAKIEDDPCENMGVHGNNQEDNDSLERQGHLLAVPGVILLCCGLMIPCFHAEKKEVSRHNTTSIQRNAGFHNVPVPLRSSLDVAKPSQPMLDKLFFNWCYI